MERSADGGADRDHRRAGARGDIVIGWLTRVVLVLSVLGVVTYDLASVVYAQVSASDVASQAAQSASDSWTTRKDIEAAYSAAEVTAEGEGGTVPRTSMSVDPSGLVKLSVSKTAPTFLLQHLGGLGKIATATRPGHAKALP